MNNYTDHDGNPWTMNQTRSRLSQDLYADLVAAIEIGRALEAKCERLELYLDKCNESGERLMTEIERLRGQNAELRKQIDRLELVS